jgi:hypothetical protein
MPRITRMSLTCGFGLTRSTLVGFGSCVGRLSRWRHGFNSRWDYKPGQHVPSARRMPRSRGTRGWNRRGAIALGLSRVRPGDGQAALVPRTQSIPAVGAGGHAVPPTRRLRVERGGPRERKVLRADPSARRRSWPPGACDLPDRERKASHNYRPVFGSSRAADDSSPSGSRREHPLSRST